MSLILFRITDLNAKYPLFSELRDAVSKYCGTSLYKAFTLRSDFVYYIMLHESNSEKFLDQFLDDDELHRLLEDYVECRIWSELQRTYYDIFPGTIALDTEVPASGPGIFEERGKQSVESRARARLP